MPLFPALPVFLDRDRVCARFQFKRRSNATMNFDDPIIIAIPPAILGF